MYLLLPLAETRELRLFQKRNLCRQGSDTPRVSENETPTTPLEQQHGRCLAK